MKFFLRWGALILVGAIWGSAYACTSVLLRDLNPYELLIFRFLPVSIIALTVLMLFYRRDTIRLLVKNPWVWIVLSVSWLYMHQYTQIVGIQVIPSGPAGLIINTYPVFTVLLATIFLGEKLTWNRIVGCMLAFVGAGFLIFSGASSVENFNDIETSKWITYGLILLISPIGSAIHTLLAKPYLSGKNRDGETIDPFVLNLLYMVPCVVLLIPMMLTVDLPDLSSFSTSFWVVLSILVFLVTLVGYYLFIYALKHLEASTVAIAIYLVPVFGLIYARFWLNEPMGIGTIISSIGIIAGVVIASIEFTKSNGR